MACCLGSESNPDENYTNMGKKCKYVQSDLPLSSTATVINVIASAFSTSHCTHEPALCGCGITSSRKWDCSSLNKINYMFEI